MKYAQRLQNFKPPTQGTPPCLLSTKPVFAYHAVLESRLAKFLNWGDHTNRMIWCEIILDITPRQ